MIRWKRTEDGFVHSHDGEWTITPNYFSCVRPQSFTLSHKVMGRWVVVDRNCATQRDAKNMAG